MAPIPKPVGQLHGHRAPPAVTKIATAPRWVDEDGNICYAAVEPAEIACREPADIVYYPVKLPPGIIMTPDPEEDG